MVVTTRWTWILTSLLGSLLFTSQLQAQVLDPQQFNVISENCSPSVKPELMAKIVAVESGFHPFAIGVNDTPRKSYKPSTKSDAITLAKNLINSGKSIDLGLGQINSKNLQSLKLSVDQIFDSCTNLRAAATILRIHYDKARSRGADSGTALQQALSGYNTGSLTRGFGNGYVQRVLGKGLAVSTETAKIQNSAASNKPSQTSTFNVFGSASSNTAIVFK